MRQITKQPILPEKMMYMEKEVIGYKSIAECFNNYFASVFFKTILKLLVHLIKVQKYFLMTFSLAKRL